MAGEARAQRDYRENRPGYYVCNAHTGIPVAFFKDYDRAKREAEYRAEGCVFDFEVVEVAAHTSKGGE